MIKYPIKFKTAILERINGPLIIDEVAFNGPLGVGQVLVRIHYSGICGKQMEEINGSGKPDPYLPHMLGHEGSGIVMDVGPGVRKVVPGDHVVLHWLKGSGIDAATPIYMRDGERVNAGWITTFNEYGVIPENRITPIPKESDLSVACLLGCAVTTGVGVIFNEAKLRPGESAAIFGCGGVGLCAVQGAALVQGFPIIAVDKNSHNLDLAVKLGASHKVNSASEKVISKIMEITNGQGVNHVIVTGTAPQFIELAVQVTSTPGSVLLVGVPSAGSKITVDALDIHRRRMLTGSYGGGCFPDRDIPRYLGLYQRGHLKLDELVSEIITLDNINKGINTLIPGKPGRCVVRMIEE